MTKHLHMLQELAGLHSLKMVGNYTRLGRPITGVTQDNIDAEIKS